MVGVAVKREREDSESALPFVAIETSKGGRLVSPLFIDERGPGAACLSSPTLSLSLSLSLPLTPKIPSK